MSDERQYRPILSADKIVR